MAKLSVRCVRMEGASSSSPVKSPAPARAARASRRRPTTPEPLWQAVVLPAEDTADAEESAKRPAPGVSDGGTESGKRRKKTALTPNGAKNFIYKKHTATVFRVQLANRALVHRMSHGTSKMDRNEARVQFTRAVVREVPALEFVFGDNDFIESSKGAKIFEVVKEAEKRFMQCNINATQTKDDGDEAAVWAPIATSEIWKEVRDLGISLYVKGADANNAVGSTADVKVPEPDVKVSEVKIGGLPKKQTGPSQGESAAKKVAAAAMARRQTALTEATANVGEANARATEANARAAEANARKIELETRIEITGMAMKILDSEREIETKVALLRRLGCADVAEALLASKVSS